MRLVNKGLILGQILIFLVSCSSTSANAGLSASPSSLNFGSLTVNSTGSATITLTNGGRQTITIQQASTSLPEFTITGPALPANVGAGNSATFQVTFRPDSAKTFSGSLSFILNRTSGGTKTVTVQGTGLASTAPQVGVTPGSEAFTATVGSSQSQSVTISSKGTSTLNITSANVSGTGFSISGLTLPLNLPPGQSSKFSVKFAPTAAGSFTGAVSLVSNSTNSPTQVSLTGSSTQAASVTGVTISPTSPSVKTGQTIQFSDSVQGTATDTSVTWTASAGTITSTGLFTAPSTAATVTVTATSNADATKKASTTVTVTSPLSTGTGPLPAFPEAQGGGALTVGGRGGVAYEVSNLNDSGSGSLRACVQASGPRTCVFRTGGTIALASALIITNPYITIAGQTAPGDGIQITATGITAAPTHIFQINTHDVIIRYLRLRHGYNPVDTAGSGDGSAVIVGNYGDGYNVIVDHCSLQWAHGESYNTWSNDTAGKHNQTLSWSIAGEVLQGHAVPILVGAASLAGAASMTDIDIHHNLIATDTHRFPLFKSANGRFVNNLIYNWSYYASLSGGGAVVDYINNIYKAGPLNAAAGTTSSWEITAYSAPTCTTCGPSGTPSIYMAGNLGPNDPAGANNAANMFRQDSYEGPGTITAAPLSWVRSTPQGAGTGIAITADSTTNLATNILNAVGASQQLTCDGSFVNNRDSVDARMISEYRSGTGSIPKSPGDKGGLPLLAAGTACADSDHDGIPDVYEIAHGLNPNNASDGAALAPNGYTNLENYLNGTPSDTPSADFGEPRNRWGDAKIKSSFRLAFQLSIFRIWESLFRGTSPNSKVRQ